MDNNRITKIAEQRSKISGEECQAAVAQRGQLSKMALDHNIADFASGQEYEMVLQDQSVLDGIDDATNFIDLPDASKSAPEAASDAANGMPLTILENQELQQAHQI